MKFNALSTLRTLLLCVLLDCVLSVALDLVKLNSCQTSQRHNRSQDTLGSLSSGMDEVTMGSAHCRRLAEIKFLCLSAKRCSIP